MLDQIDGDTAFSLAVLYCDEETVSSLVKHPDFDVNLKTFDVLLPLNSVLSKGMIDVAQKLYDKGASPIAEDGRGMTPFWSAAVENGAFEAVKWIVERLREWKQAHPAFDLYAYVNKSHYGEELNSGNSVLHYLASGYNNFLIAQGPVKQFYSRMSKAKEIFAYLIKKKLADLDKQNDQGKKPFELLTAPEESDLAKLLKPREMPAEEAQVAQLEIVSYSLAELVSSAA